MTEIYCITDYKEFFGSKFNAVPYRSGYDKLVIKELFYKEGYDVKFIQASQVDFLNFDWKDKIVLYTSSEEYQYLYKKFLEDIIYGLKLAGAKIVPHDSHLLANNNKVIMEIIRQTLIPKELVDMQALLIGSYDDLLKAVSDNKIKYPCVIKKAAGAKSRGVFMVRSKEELLEKAKKISFSGLLLVRIKEYIRKKMHKGYIPESNYQNKFVIQPLIEGLSNDWKVLIYGEKYFVLKRDVRKNDFRASGSGLNYKSGKDAGLTIEQLNFLRSFFKALNVPNLSIDYGFDGKKGYIFEFQAIYYGIYTQIYSENYYEFCNGEWLLKEDIFTPEEIYVHSIKEFLNMNRN